MGQSRLKWVGVTSLGLVVTLALVVTGAATPPNMPREAAIEAAMLHCPGYCTYCPNWEDFSCPSGQGNDDDVHCICDHQYVCNLSCDGEQTEEEARVAARVRAEAIVAASEGAAREIAQLVKSHPQIVLLNADRSAIQIRGCNGLVIGHIPLDSHALAAVADEL